MNNIKQKILLAVFIVCLVATLPFLTNRIHENTLDQVFPPDTMFKITLHSADGGTIREWITCGPNIHQHASTDLIYFRTNSGKSYGISGTVVIEQLE